MPRDLKTILSKLEVTEKNVFGHRSKKDLTVAKLLWGKVYLGDVFSGFMREEPDGRVDFVYDGGFIDSGRPAGASKPTLNRFERGVTAIRLDSVFKILRVLGLA